MNIVELKQAVQIRVMKQVKDTAAALAANMLADFVQTQQAIRQAALAPHPTAGHHIDVRV